MKNQFLTLWVSLLLLSNVTAQNLIPYLGATGKYGYATEDGKVVIPAIYPEINEIMPAQKIFTVLPNTDSPVFLLRNGLRIPTDNPRNVVVGVRNYAVDGTFLDSIKHLLVFPKSREFSLYDQRSKTQKTWLQSTSNNATNWFSGYRLQNINYLEPFQFTEGTLAVWKTNGSMNFVDTDLKEVFPKDFAAGRVLDAHHFLLAEDVYKYAIGDRSGKLRTPFVWTNIMPGGRDGFFIVMGPRYDHGKSGITGLINADGKVIIDTVCRSIEPFGQFLIVGKDNKYGLMDYAGNIIRPITAQNMGPVAQKRYLLVNEYEANGGNSRSNLLDEQGKQLLPEETMGIGILTGKPFPHFLAQFPGYFAFYDTALHQITTFKGFDNGEIVASDPFIFQLSKIVGNKYQFGLYDRDGNLLSGESFDELSRLLPQVYRVKKDTLYGVINSKGESIVPIRFLSIASEYTRTDTLFWGEEANGRWMAFDRNGAIPAWSGRLAPSTFQDPVIGFKKNKDDGTTTAIFADGSRFTMPDSLMKDWGHPQQLRTPSGGMLIFNRYRNNQQQFLYFDERMHNLIPPGFVAIDKHSDKGLLAVMRIKTEPKPADKPEMEAEIEAVKEGGKAQVYATKTLQFDACGVLTADGKWALPPKKGVIYQPLSAYIVVELPVGTELKKGITYPDLLRIHRVNQSPQAPIEVNYLFDDSFEKGRTTIRMGKTFPKLRDRILPAYFDEKGNQLTPFGVWQGPFYLKSRNIITLINLDKPKEIKQLIINEKGETLFELENLSCGKLPNEKGQNWKLDYLVVSKKMSVEEMEKLGKISNWVELNEVAKNLRTLQGIIDSTGQMVQPIHYLNLQIIEADRLFCARDSSTGSALLYNWQGELLHRFPPISTQGYANTEPASTLPLKNGGMVVGDGVTSILVSKENKVAKVFDAQQTGATDMEKRFVQMKNKAGQVFWMRSDDGYEYRQ